MIRLHGDCDIGREYCLDVRLGAGDLLGQVTCNLDVGLRFVVEAHWQDRPLCRAILRVFPVDRVLEGVVESDVFFEGPTHELVQIVAELGLGWL